MAVSNSATRVGCLSFFPTVVMSDPPPGKQSKESHLLRPFKRLFSRLHSRSPSPSRQGAQSVTPHNATASISASPTNIVAPAPRASYQGAQSVIPHKEESSIFALPTNDAASAPQASYRSESVTPQNEKASISALPTIGAMSASQVGIVTGNPGVFQGNLHPYPRKTAPAVTGRGFRGYGLRVSLV